MSSSEKEIQMRKKILIIDADPHTRELIAISMRQLGHNPVQAWNGCEGIDKTLNEHPDLVLMDLELLDLWGIAVAKRIKEDYRPAKIPVIAHPAWGLEYLRNEALQAGFSDFLARPAAPERLAQVIEKFTNRSGE